MRFHYLSNDVDALRAGIISVSRLPAANRCSIGKLSFESALSIPRTMNCIFDSVYFKPLVIFPMYDIVDVLQPLRRPLSGIIVVRPSAILSPLVADNCDKNAITHESVSIYRMRYYS